MYSTLIPGRPDLIFVKARVAVFCDGDFWHGRDWRSRRAKLATGANSRYWIAKIQGNIERDKRVNAMLKTAGWIALRFWESDLKLRPMAAAKKILRVVQRRRIVS